MAFLLYIREIDLLFVSNKLQVHLGNVSCKETPNKADTAGYVVIVHQTFCVTESRAVKRPTSPPPPHYNLTCATKTPLLFYKQYLCNLRCKR